MTHAREKKKPSGRGSYKSHFHAILKPNTLPNRFLRDLFVFVIDKSASGATIRETAQIIAEFKNVLVSERTGRYAVILKFLNMRIN